MEITFLCYTLIIICDDINNAINDFKKVIVKYNNLKLNEIYINLQLIHCWPIIPTLTNMFICHESDKKNDQFKSEKEEEIQKLNTKTQELNDKYEDLKGKIKELNEKLDDLSESLQKNKRNDRQQRA